MTNVTHRQGAPPEAASDEAKASQLELARNQGRALGEAIREMTERVADDGAEQRAGDYLVGYAVEEAEGMYQLQEGELTWIEPQDENVHLEIAVRDGGDGRFVPGLTVYATLRERGGREIGTHQQPFLWHPWLYHYGRNWRVPASGEYDLHVRIEPATFMRHDRINGRRYGKPVEVEFQGIRIKTGQKHSS